MKTIALIPVRGGSKSIPGKNIRPLGGRPLLHYTLEAALHAERIDEVWVSSDSEEILRVALELSHPKLRLSRRPAELATDTASTESVMLDLARREQFDRMVLVQATSPLTTAQELDEALDLLSELHADSLVTVTHEHRFRWSSDPSGRAVAENYRPEARPRRQDWAGDYYENGAFYVSTRSLLLGSGSRLHGHVARYVMPRASAIELDTPEDWALVEALLGARSGAGAHINVGRVLLPLERLRAVRLIVSDVDGVLTDGGMYYGPSGESSKKFNTKDGFGIRKWLEMGREFAVITGENSPAVHERMKKLGIHHYFPAVSDKGRVLAELEQRLGISREQVLYIGDDENDLSVLPLVQLFVCPRDAAAAVRRLADFECRCEGGAGAVREVIERLLEAAGETALTLK